MVKILPILNMLDKNFRIDLKENLELIVNEIEEAQRRISREIVEGSSIEEVQDARDGEDVLNERLKRDFAKKISKGEVSVKDINKNKGKVDQTFLTEELLAQIAGTASINAVPEDKSITKEKYADRSIMMNVLGEEVNQVLGSENNNLFNGETFTGVVDSGNGQLNNTDEPDRLASDFVEVEEGQMITTNWLDIVDDSSLDTQRVYFYDADQSYLGYADFESNSFIPMQGTKFIRENLKNKSDWEARASDYAVYQTKNLFSTDITLNKEKTWFISETLGLTYSEVSNKRYVYGSVNSGNGDLTNADQTDRISTDYMLIDSSMPLYTNYLELVTPEAEEQRFIFYDENKNFLESPATPKDFIQPPKDAQYVRQNLKSGSSFEVSVEDYYVYQHSNKYEEKIKEAKKETESLETKILGVTYGDKTEVNVYDFYDDTKTDTEIINDCLLFASLVKNKRIVFDQKDWNIDEAILIPSYTEVVVDGVIIKQNNEVFDNIFRGDNLEIDPDNPNNYPLSVSPLVEVKVIGKNGAQLIGCDVNKTALHEPTGETQEMVGDYWGWRTLQISFSLGNDIEISGLSLTQTRCWAISFDKCKNFYVHDLDIVSDVKNGDGVDVRAGCSNFKIENITGNTSDDTVACTALNPTLEYPRENYVYTLEPTRFMNPSMSLRELDIHHGQISNVHTGGDHHGVICLCSGGLRVHNILINKISETNEGSRFSTVKIYAGYGSGYSEGDLNSIRVNDVTAEISDWAIEIDADVEDVWINKVVQNNPDGTISEVSNSGGVTFTNS